MLKNYYGQLQASYPEKKELLEWMKYALDSRVYYFGQHFRMPYEGMACKKSLKARLDSLYLRFKKHSASCDGAVVSNAYFNVAEYIRKGGYDVILPPWQTQSLSKDSQDTLQQMIFADFNLVLSDDFQHRVYCLRDELREFFKKKHTPFMLLANDLNPIHRMAIDVCRELEIPTGIFLHGLPARYNHIDDSRADYLFVWGEKIKDNYIDAGSKTNVVVVGHPNFSSFNIGQVTPQNVVVLSRAICGAPSSSNIHRIDERGICIQHIYAVETALKKIGINHAILRLHPSENPEWYAKFMDKDFYSLDTNSLDYTLSHAKMVTGYISTVMLDTVLNDIPCYPFVIDKGSNVYADELVPPFCDRHEFPTACTVDELVENIKAERSVKREHFDGYVSPLFDINKIIQFIKK